LAGENRMLEGRDAGCSHSQQYFSVRDRWFWKIYELQPFITTEFFRSHCTHINPPVLGCDHRAVTGCSQRKTRQYPSSVDQNRACPAGAVVATFLGASQVRSLA